MFQPPPSRVTDLAIKMADPHPTSKLWTSAHAASMEAAVANVGGSSAGVVVSSPYQSSSLCYPGVSNSFIQPHQYHHPSKASAVIEDMNTTYQPHQNYHHYQNWLPNAAAASVTSPTATTASTTPIHVNYIMNSNVIHNYHAPQHYSYPPQSFQVCNIRY